MSNRVPLSVLDLVPVSQGMTRHDAFVASAQLVQAAERSGYHRYWVAEHHGSDTFMASATSLVLGHLAQHSATIRLGSGGVMLPNHAPLMVAEYYGTLAEIYGDRFDLGLGRAPGTDPMTAAALRRNHGELDTFAEDVVLLRRLLADPATQPDGSSLARPTGGRGIRAVPGEGTKVPLWMLGSSTGGAQVAAALGLPFSFASHFAPDALDQALTLYRQNFQPSEQLSAPRTMAGVSVLVADSQEEAERQFTTSQLLRFRIRTGQIAPLDPPVDQLSQVLPEQAIPYAGKTTGVATMVGTPDRVVELLEVFVDQHALDEVIVATYTHDPSVRLHSHELLADAWLR